MMFIDLNGGRTKRLKGKFGGDKQGFNSKCRRDDRHDNVESKRRAERKSARRLREDFVVVDALSERVVAMIAPEPVSGKNTFVTDDGASRITLIYDDAGRCLCCHVRPAHYSRH